MMVFLIGAVVMVVCVHKLNIDADLTTGSTSTTGSSINSGIGGAQIVSNAKKTNAESNIKSENHQSRELARGLAGLPLSETPALIGGSRGHIQCEVDVDELVYWNDPQGTRDVNFQSPFTGKSHGDEEQKTKYLTFEPDRGGWNNIRMNLENVFILAAATGRTLVMPPAVPVYLLNVSS